MLFRSQDNIDDGNDDQEPGNGLPFREVGQIGDIRKRRAKGVGSNCQEKAADAKGLFPVILGDD